MIIIADSSPLIALAMCRALDLLPQLFTQVWVTPEVYLEVTQAGKPFIEQLSSSPIFFSPKLLQQVLVLVDEN